MLSSTVSFAVHLYSSLQGVQTFRRALGYVLPYSNMASVKVNFNTKHLTKGDPLPPFTGKLRVYNMRYCPFAQRTVLALIAKNVDYEVVNVDLKDKPEWLTSVSAFGKVPALQISEDVSIFESLVTVEYLDEVYPQRPLLPKDPLLKAKDKIVVEGFNGVHALYFKLVTAPENVTEDNIAAYIRGIDLVQSELEQRGTKFLDGELPGYADYMIWPWFERLHVNKSEVAKLDEKKYKTVLTYIDNLGKDPAIAEYRLPDEALLTFQTAYINKVKPNYDLLLEK
ncbi:hypothetical protein PYW07_013935 [Mythimna separata]|uniref:Glutathione S-transferase n=1 Tax=Mythimna separata TaxID=271217 RepID=A0A9E9GFY9_MYTSE|nr:hypothetical protein PYW07_013935 [Mythimna separata]WAS27847.1 glutathione S-transferase [Mythimna separata]